MLKALERAAAQLLLRMHVRARGVGVPVVRSSLRWLGRLLVPRDARVWTQVQSGVGKGLWIAVNPRTGTLYREGAVEPATQRVLQDHLRPGDTFYDLGANMGFFALLAARLVGDEGRVVAFEPDPDVASRLRENVVRNGFRNVSVVQAGVWSKTGELGFSRADPLITADLGLGHVTTDGSDGETERIQAYALDDFVVSATPPSFIKCDVEGAETEALQGARWVLETYRPGVYVEAHSSEKCVRVLAQLKEAGYTDVRLVDGCHVLGLPEPARIAPENPS